MTATSLETKPKNRHRHGLPCTDETLTAHVLTAMKIDSVVTHAPLLYPIQCRDDPLTNPHPK